MARDVRSQDEPYQRARLVGTRAWAFLGVAASFVVITMALGIVGYALEVLLVGIIIGFICSPLTNWLEERGLPRALGALIALVIVLAAFAFVLVMLVPPTVQQLIALLGRVPEYVASVQQGWNAYVSGLDAQTASQNADLSNNVSGWIQSLGSIGTKAATNAANNLTSGIIPNIMAMVSNLFNFFLGLVVAYWLAKDYPKIMREFAIIAGPSHSDELTLLFAVMSRSMSGYMRGIVLTSAIDGILSFVFFAAIGHPYAALMGIAVGIAHFVPVIGPWIAVALATAVALFVSPLLALETLIVSVIIQNVVDNLLSPLVFQSAVRVHPVLTLIAIVIGSCIGGILGMALAVPLSAAIKGVFIYYFETRTGRQLVSYDGALFKSTPYKDDRGEIVPSFDALDDDRFFETSRLVPQARKEGAPIAAPVERPEGTHAGFAETLRIRREEAKRAYVRMGTSCDLDERFWGGTGTHATPAGPESPAPPDADGAKDEPDAPTTSQNR
ncbi:MAG: AI-2E family transporter [Atopobiaceae bacterium]|nr:AI-2E family transporter [Atopobiaceae bacterium]